MTPFIVHSRAGEAATRHESLSDALRLQETLRGAITRGDALVAEALS